MNGEDVKQFRLDEGLTQNQAASLFFYKLRYYQMIESGETPVPELVEWMITVFRRPERLRQRIKLVKTDNGNLP